jgi:hypothetical protein
MILKNLKLQGDSTRGGISSAILKPKWKLQILFWVCNDHETKLKMLLSQLGMKNVKGNFNQSAWEMGIHN